MEIEEREEDGMEVEEKSHSVNKDSELQNAQREGLPWVEKYRPNSLDELIAHENIISTINKLIEANRLPHLLFYGPPGTGKTSTILACARKLYGKSFNSMVLELNASDDRGIDVVREQIKNFASTQQLFSSGVKLIILDEADQMTNTAQFALRRVVEKYTKNVRFCMICNYVSKIIPALQSRCTRFRFAPLLEHQIKGRLQEIARAEKVTMTEGGINAILRLCGGDMRRVLNILQSTSMAFDTVDENNVYACTGSPKPKDIKEILNSLLSSNFSDSYNFILNKQRDAGIALRDIITDLIKHVLVLDRLDGNIRRHIISNISDIEYNLAYATHERIQLTQLIGTFISARDMMKVKAS